MGVDTTTATDDALKALAEPVRRRIIERLSAEELCVCHLVDDLGLPQPLVSHHLRVLRRVGLVEADRHRQWVYYRLRRDVLADLGARISTWAAAAPDPGERRRPCG